MEQSFVDLIKAGEAMKAEIAELKAQLEAVSVDQILAALVASEQKTTAAELALDALHAAVAKKITQHLQEAEVEKALVVCETFHDEKDDFIPQFERKAYDSAFHAPSILAFNGRSLDSHNPWHLRCSYREFLEKHFPEPKKAGKAAKSGSTKVSSSWTAFDPDSFISQNSDGKEEVVGSSPPPTTSISFGMLAYTGRNKVAASTSGHSKVAASSPPPFYGAGTRVDALAHLS